MDMRVESKNIIPLVKHLSTSETIVVKFGNMTEPFYEGAQAYVDGKKARDNPHSVKSKPWEDWRDGWAFCKAVALCILILKEGDKPR
jgi:hypothetical protein